MTNVMVSKLYTVKAQNGANQGSVDATCYSGQLCFFLGQAALKVTHALLGYVTTKIICQQLENKIFYSNACNQNEQSAMC